MPFHAATAHSKQAATDLAGFQAFLKDRRLARDDPVPTSCDGGARGVSPLYCLLSIRA